MSKLRINLLGEPDISYAGQGLKFPTRKALGLFIYLVVEGGLHRREKLSALFWPESEDQLAKAALRNTLARLRRTLAVAGTPLVGEAGAVGFDFDCPYALDLQLIAQAQKRGRPTPLLQALEAYRAEFLTAFSLGDAPAFDDWVLNQREAWRQRLNALFEKVSQQQLDRGDVAAALTTTRRWVEHDPLHEAAYRRLMQLQSLAGNRGAALEAFAGCQRLLATELGVEPAPETIKLAQHIRDIPMPLRPFLGADDLRLGTKKNRKSKIQSRRPAELPLTGRGTAYARLSATYRQAPQIVVVAGEAGIGKTRLVTEFLHWATLQGADVIKSRAFEMGGRLPYQPLIDALRDRIEVENAPEDWLSDVWLAELSYILPELRERYPDLPVYNREESLAQSHLFEAIARLGEALSERRPVVLFIDDVQWAGETSRDLLHYLGRRWVENRSPILLVFTLQSEVLSSEPLLRAWLAGLEQDVPLTRLSLKALTAEDIAHLVKTLAGRPSDRETETEDAGAASFAEWLFQETAGNPFFVNETLKMLFEAGILQRGQQGEVDLAPAMRRIAQQGQVPLPSTVRKVIVRRLAGLDAPEMALVTAATVIGRDCSFELLCAVSGLDEPAALGALETLLAKRLLLEQQDVQRPYLLAHDKIRDVAYTEAGEARRRIYHRRALDTLAQAQAPAAELAHHALEAREWESAFRHSLTAGDEAMRLFAAPAAIHHYECALHLLREERAVAATVACQHLYTRLGRAIELQNRFPDALAIYEEMDALALVRGSREMELAAMLARGTVLSLPYAAQDVAGAEALAGRALPLARELGDLAAEAKIEWNLLLLHILGKGRAIPAIAHGEASAELAARAGLREQLGFTLSDLGLAYMAAGRIEKAEAVLLEAVAILRELGNRAMLTNPLNFLAILQLWRGAFDKSLAYLDECYRASKVVGGLNNYPWIATTRSVTHLFRGEYDRILAELRPLLEMDEAHVVPRALGVAQRQLAWLHYDLGAYAQGMAHCRQAFVYHNRASAYDRPPTLTQLALLHLGRGELPQAASLVAKRLADYAPDYQTFSELGNLVLPLSGAQAELALATGDTALAAYHAGQLLERYQQLNICHFKPAALHLRGRVALAQGEKEGAYEWLAAALALADEIGVRREVWAICWALSSLEAARGNRSGARQLWERARAEAAFIADHAGTPKLRATFLSRPDVREIVAGG